MSQSEADYLLLNCTGLSKEASPRFASAQAHQICTFAMSRTYSGTVMLLLNLSPLIFRRWSK